MILHVEVNRGDHGHASARGATMIITSYCPGA
jgi:hypothetical protein